MLLSLILLASGIARVGQGYQPFPDTPKNHWAYEGIGYLKSQGFLVGYPDGLGYNRQRTKGRYEFAVAYYAVAAHLQTLEASWPKMADDIAESKELVKALEPDDFERMLASPLLSRSMDYVERASKEFRTELIELGVNPNNLIVAAEQCKSNFAHFKFPKPGSALKPFTDVPPNHWAFAATTNLRAVGILHGHPDGTFNGN